MDLFLREKTTPKSSTKLKSQRVYQNTQKYKNLKINHYYNIYKCLLNKLLLLNKTFAWINTNSLQDKNQGKKSLEHKSFKGFKTKLKSKIF
jgi:hypothetical protein